MDIVYFIVYFIVYKIHFPLVLTQCQPLYALTLQLLLSLHDK